LKKDPKSVFNANFKQSGTSYGKTNNQKVSNDKFDGTAIERSQAKKYLKISHILSMIMVTTK
jgi:hypothetical protein